jgi:glycosyltransferase involved in cell wall biosynthesis
LFKAGDPEALAGAVLDLHRHPERWAALESNARSFVENDRNWPNSVGRYREVYAKLVGKGEI